MLLAQTMSDGIMDVLQSNVCAPAAGWPLGSSGCWKSSILLFLGVPHVLTYVCKQQICKYPHRYDRPGGMHHVTGTYI